jgi:TrwC relaxase
MSLHKLTAGYDYLTRQVAALDATEEGHTGLASYYTERGETPGVWIGSGLDRIDGLGAGDPVTAEQMRALFGCGLHPLAELRQQQLAGPDLTLGIFKMRRGWEGRSRSLLAGSARSGSRWPNASGQSIPQRACPWVRRCRRQIGPEYGPRWPASSSWPSMAASRWKAANWRSHVRPLRAVLDGLFAWDQQ